MGSLHQLDAAVRTDRWDNTTPARITVAPGDTVQLEMADASGFQVQPDWATDDFRNKFDSAKVHALTGPIAIDGAEPGDQLVVHIEDFQHQGWAWTSLIPGLGLLADDFPNAHLFIWQLEADKTHSFPGVTLELNPFAGIIGVQRAESGEFRTRAPGPFGGNMDVRHLTAGTTLYLPVQTLGANLLAGDCHAAQGDGEVCINGMEAPMTGQFRFELIKQTPLSSPYAKTQGPLVSRHYDKAPWHLFIESADDPREACKAVVRRAIDFIQGRVGGSPEMAYTLCSVVLDLKVSQLVNVPTTTITGYLPEAIFDK